MTTINEVSMTVSDIDKIWYTNNLDEFCNILGLEITHIEYVDIGNAVISNKHNTTIAILFLLNDNRWVIHHDSAPAWCCENGNVYFFYEGINMKIDAMPIDDDIKLILKLKYEYCGRTPNGYEWYK